MLLFELGITTLQNKLHTALKEWAHVETKARLRNTDECSKTTNRNSH